MFDIFGDIHGHASTFEGLLKKLGYQKISGVYRHSERKALILGDMVDRGPQQVETVNIVRSMVEAGNALAIMGNHEYNAVAFASEDPEAPGEFLRKHTKSNIRQHHEFLKQVGEGSSRHKEMIDWFKTLPIYIDDFGIRAIHACWHHRCIESLEPFLDKNKALKSEAWVPASRKGSVVYDAVENVLKGLEISLPEGMSYLDADGTQRTKTRTKWWDENANTYREAGLISKALREKLPTDSLPAEAMIKYDGKVPLFFGHYWMKGRPSVINERMVCLDYSIGKGDSNGSLCAYRWSGEEDLVNENLDWLNSTIEPKFLYT